MTDIPAENRFELAFEASGVVGQGTGDPPPDDSGDGQDGGGGE